MDILEDDRYDQTPSSSFSVVISNAAVNKRRFSRRKILKSLKLPLNSTWDEVNPILTSKLVFARNNNNDELAIYWSTIRDELEKRLARRCDCGVVISSVVTKCKQCAMDDLSKSQRLSVFALPESFEHHLGKYSDNQLAKVYKVPRTTLSTYRRKRGIRPFDCFAGESYVTPRREWPEEIISKMGKMPDREIDKIYGINWVIIFRERKRRGIPKFTKIVIPQKAINLMGKRSDGKIAKKFKLDRKIIQNERKRLGIPAFVPPSHFTQWSQEIIDRLGKELDKKIAKAIGVSPQSVARERKRRGIPVFKQNEN
jgi:hypothetical protein